MREYHEIEKRLTQGRKELVRYLSLRPCAFAALRFIFKISNSNTTLRLDLSNTRLVLPSFAAHRPPQTANCQLSHPQ